ncbi:UDP-2,3-diacylglucosamine hydrolase [Oceanospirillum multiglobuliferum]|uniref:UDP-2,3-diacylglucosamine hydrolase n=1 Tax=Oceanospirillum multiglobuliferum TaxID=64969 RepID=A0A1T4P4M3_9GAMM|nr:UDP-2,3-diacylglucosamine diphosphatase [Oceanospirillum multiglobuliferum]OPX54831.1 UDP-2,3-diacylglucosamine diphosphatase [Oceanospirillum multiglobuliferum]SJZ86206.1 UDP-2,3-diacylglucosamine hydrolase [Oceanospirillum multiglobuliferum]
MKQIFISDLHLKTLDDPITERFFTFLDQVAIRADQLYILGDFFEYWLGDDYQTPLSIAVAERLSYLSQQGVALFFMAGNRDFLLKDDYAKQCGMTLLPDPYALPAPQQHILLSHGDRLCTDDVEYQKIRPMLRNPQWQSEFIAKSIPERIAFASQARQQSQSSQQQAQDSGYGLVDVNLEAVDQLMREYQCNLLIHGHTHRPKQHTACDGQALRLVLSDWDNQVFYIEINANQTPELKHWH